MDKVQAIATISTLEVCGGLEQTLLARDDEDPCCTCIIDLPAVVLGSILTHIANPVDVMSTLLSCRLFLCLICTVPLRLRLQPRQYDKSPTVANVDDILPKSDKVTSQTTSSWTHVALRAICAHMCATCELDVTGCFIIDDDVVSILSNLRCLERLVLDNCQQLTSAVVDLIAASIKSGPISLSMMRCFNIKSFSLRNLLVAFATNGSRLQSILLSHFDSLDTPQDELSSPNNGVYKCERDLTQDSSDTLKNLGSLSCGSRLRILALNNCVGITTSHLMSLAMLCPHLELLLLGGSIEALGLSRVEAESEDTISSISSTLVRIIELLRRLQVLELTFFTAAVVQAVRVQAKRKIQIWDFCEESSVAAASWFLDGLKSAKPGSAINDCLRHFSRPTQFLNNLSIQDTATISPILFSKNIRAQFWQDGLTLSDCLSTGSFAYSNYSSCEKLKFPLGLIQNEDKWKSAIVDVSHGLRGAANCSDVRMRTPLHMAAARGDVPMIAGLLAIGAIEIGMKDSSGGTALFAAAELGYAQACELLLHGGADVLASNQAGETPLYIAALRGHSAAVAIMLAHCHEHGVNWQDAHVYGMPLLPHIVPSFGGPNFAQRSLKMYPKTRILCQSLQAKPGSTCFSRLWEPTANTLHGIQRSRIVEMWQRCYSRLQDMSQGWISLRRSTL